MLNKLAHTLNTEELHTICFSLVNLIKQILVNCLNIVGVGFTLSINVPSHGRLYRMSKSFHQISNYSSTIIISHRK